jgi:hypothetical protein
MANKSKVKVGDVVRFVSGGTVITGEVIEDRGPLGVGGRQLWRVRITLGPEFTGDLEMTADRFEVVRDKAG